MPDGSNKFCPACHSVGRFLANTSANATVNFYICDWCWNIWTMTRYTSLSRSSTIVRAAKQTITK